MDAPKPRVALIAGPTASGKSAVALRLADLVDGAVINADASQVYRELRILSARPSAEEEARVPHRLFGYREGADPCSAADWAADARHAIEATLAEGRVPILAGGTGLYLRTLIDGIAPVPEIDPHVRTAVRALTAAQAYAALEREDPVAAARLRVTDASRIARALEVVRSTGRSLAAWQADRVGGIGGAIDLVALVLLPPREWLRERIAERFEAMVELGAVEEVERLLARGLDPGLPVMRAIGVREIAAWLRGAVDRDAMIAAAVTATRQYAKRQYTWFRHQPPADWTVEQTQPNAALAEQCAIKLRDKLLT